MFIFYELDVCVFSISLCWSPPFQCDGIWDGSFWRYLFRLPEVMRVEPHDRTSAFVRSVRDTRIFSLCSREEYRSTYWEGCYLQARNRAFTKNQTSRHLDLGLFSLQNCENINVLCKPPRIWDFVIAAQTDEGSNPVSKALHYSHGLMGKRSHRNWNLWQRPVLPTIRYTVSNSEASCFLPKHVEKSLNRLLVGKKCRVSSPTQSLGVISSLMPSSSLYMCSSMLGPT